MLTTIYKDEDGTVSSLKLTAETDKDREQLLAAAEHFSEPDSEAEPASAVIPDFGPHMAVIGLIRASGAVPEAEINPNRVSEPALESAPDEADSEEMTEPKPETVN